ncbi:HU family DNA-binding protein [Ornithinimicrobium sp. F0845]|uniref:HU family DNA-binding protein n=1 Tax=Ornithinimicrobium sp. F0845 TaxID=2926412 RepID=UPI0032B27776|nr:HU family DNA-binding protein [Ornithinimicrobium sp. F0845]
MNKAELIDRLSTRLGSRREATLAIEALVDVVIREVAAGGTVGITGFGTFERAERAPRTGRNPRTGQSVPIAGTRTPRFRPGTYFKAVVSDPDELPREGLAGGRAPASGSTRSQERGAG